VDLLVPRKILSVDAARDAFVGFRLRGGVGTLDGATTARGTCTGYSVLLGADVAWWRRWGLSGILGWNRNRTTTTTPWSRMLQASGGSDRVSWDGGGLSLDFQLRWGPDRDTTGAAKPAAQKK
jgi:hypothetical protein